MKLRKFLAAATAVTLLLGVAVTPEVGSEIKLALTAHAESSEIPIDAAHFPDEIFRQSILDELDTDKNGSLSTEEAAVATSMQCQSEGITSLKGIEYFTELALLDCSYNQITELDVSENKKLDTLYCTDCGLDDLDLSENTELLHLYCSNNQFTELDVSKNTELEEMACDNNKLTKLNISGCAKLGSLSCASNKLTELDVSKNTELTVLCCEDNQLAKLNVSSCAKLKWFACYTNKFTELDISNNPNIVKAYTEGVDTGYLPDGVFGKEFDENLIDGTYYYILWDKATKLITGIEPEEVEAGTADVSGMQNNPNVDVTEMGITFKDNSGKTYTAEVQADGKIMLPSLPAGDYTVTASLENCPSRDYTVKVESGKPVELDVELKLYGDLNGDGILTVFDVMPVNKCAQKTGSLDGYDYKVADVTNDNNINVFDCMKINAHIKKTTLMW